MTEQGRIKGYLVQAGGCLPVSILLSRVGVPGVGPRGDDRLVPVGAAMKEIDPGAIGVIAPYAGYRTVFVVDRDEWSLGLPRGFDLVRVRATLLVTRVICLLRHGM